MRGFRFQLGIEPEDIIRGDQVDDAGRGHAVNLMPEDVPDPFPVIGILCLDLLA